MSEREDEGKRLERRVRDLEIALALVLSERQVTLGNALANDIDQSQADARAMVWARVAEYRQSPDYNHDVAEPPVGGFRGEP